MKNNIFKKISSLLLIVVGLIVGSLVVSADTTPLSVKAILPENQFNKSVSYYHLLMEAGKKQDIELQLFNSANQDATAIITLTSATTNDNGLLDYNLPNKKIDKSLLHPFPRIAKTAKEVKIPANQNVVTKISIEMPKEQYSGMILGGINVKVKKSDKETESDSKAGGMKIENEMNYAIGVVLVENDKLIKTTMNLKKVSASQVMGNNTTKVTLQNPTAAIIENISLEAKVYAKDSDQVLYEIKREGYRMAPNSSFDFGIPLAQERYKAGQYRVKLIATSDPKEPKDGEKQVWEFDEEFEIKRVEADKLNASAIDLPNDYSNYYMVAGFVCLCIVIFILYLFKTGKQRPNEIKKGKQRNKFKEAGKKRKVH